VSAWSPADVHAWLCSLGGAAYASCATVAREAGVDGDWLLLHLHPYSHAADARDATLRTALRVEDALHRSVILLKLDKRIAADRHATGTPVAADKEVPPATAAGTDAPASPAHPGQVAAAASPEPTPAAASVASPDAARCRCSVPRPQWHTQLKNDFAAAASSGASAAVVALTGLPGAGKTELALQFAREDTPAQPERQLVSWVFSSTSNPAALLHSYGALCAALSLSVSRPAAGRESEAAYVARMRAALETLLLQGKYELVLVFSDVAAFATVQPYIPLLTASSAEAGSGQAQGLLVRTLLTSSDESVLSTAIAEASSASSSSVSRYFAHSLSNGMEEGEALALLSSAISSSESPFQEEGAPGGGCPSHPRSHTSSNSREGLVDTDIDAVSLVRALSCLPLGVLVAGRMIAARRSASKEAAANGSDDSTYGARELLHDLQSHPFASLRLEATGVAGHVDPSASQCAAIQLALQRAAACTNPRWRELLDGTLLLDPSDLPTELLAVQSKGPADSDAFDSLEALFAAREGCGLLRTAEPDGILKPGTRCFVHRSVHLQLQILCQVKAGSASPTSAASTAFVAGASSAPSMLHYFFADKLQTLMFALRSVYPAREENPSSLTRLRAVRNSVLCVLRSVVANGLPLAHAMFASLRSELLGLARLAIASAEYDVEQQAPTTTAAASGGPAADYCTDAARTTVAALEARMLAEAALVLAPPASTSAAFLRVSVASALLALDNVALARKKLEQIEQDGKQASQIDADTKQRIKELTKKLAQA